MNHFGDLTSEERRRYFAAVDHADLPLSGSGRVHHDQKLAEWHARGSPRLPTSADWRPYIQPIANQGQCGSSPYFSACDTVTVNWALKYGKIIPVSVQQIIDCSGPEGNAGCNGGTYPCTRVPVYPRTVRCFSLQKTQLEKIHLTCQSLTIVYLCLSVYLSVYLSNCLSENNHKTQQQKPQHNTTQLLTQVS